MFSLKLDFLLNVSYNYRSFIALNYIGSLEGIELNVNIALDIVNFIILILLIHKHRMPFFLYPII